MVMTHTQDIKHPFPTYDPEDAVGVSMDHLPRYAQDRFSDFHLLMPEGATYVGSSAHLIEKGMGFSLFSVHLLKTAVGQFAATTFQTYIWQIGDKTYHVLSLQGTENRLPYLWTTRHRNRLASVDLNEIRKYVEGEVEWWYSSTG